MFDIGFGEMIMLAAIALIAIGPKQLPEVARAVGKLLGEIKKTVGEVTSTVASVRDETDRAIRKVTDDLTSEAQDIGRSIQNPPTKSPDAKPVAAAIPRDPAIHAPVPIADLPPHPGNWKPYVEEPYDPLAGLPPVATDAETKVAPPIDDLKKPTGGENT